MQAATACAAVATLDTRLLCKTTHRVLEPSVTQSSNTLLLQLKGVMQATNTG